jgi:hypothetical protein
MFTPFWPTLLMAPPPLVSVLSAGCLPRGIDHEYPIADVLTALRYQVRASVAFRGGKERVEGLRLIATDAVFTFGKDVRGSAIALLLAVSGRPVRLGGTHLGRTDEAFTLL